MKISYKILVLSLIPFSLASHITLADSENVELLNGERKASSRTSTSVSTDRRSSSSSSKKRTSKKVSSTKTTTNTNQYSQEDCATKYILGLDKECYNTNRTNTGGVYADCSDKTVADYYDIMDMQLSYIVGVDNFATYKSNCDAYKGYALNKWLASKDIIETSAVKSSTECILATNKLTSAKKCYTAAISHDGNFFEFDELMNKTCGETPDVAKKFSKAGDLGIANIPQVLENYSTLQFTNKSENWRSAVESVLAGYIYDARQACGEETYDILELNQFTEDKRENILSKAKDSFTTEVASNLGRRAGNFIQTGSATIIPSKNGVALVSNKSIKFYDNVNTANTNTLDKNIKNTIRYNSNFNNATPQLKDTENISDVYVIDDVSNINTARARLLNIIKTGDIGISDNQDETDYAIINALGGRTGSDNVGIYDIISNLIEGDSFIIKDTYKNCQVLRLNNNNEVEKLSKREILNNKSLKTYIDDCKKVIE